ADLDRRQRVQRRHPRHVQQRGELQQPATADDRVDSPLGETCEREEGEGGQGEDEDHGEVHKEAYSSLVGSAEASASNSAAKAVSSSTSRRRWEIAVSSAREAASASWPQWER